MYSYLYTLIYVLLSNLYLPLYLVILQKCPFNFTLYKCGLCLNVLTLMWFQCIHCHVFPYYSIPLNLRQCEVPISPFHQDHVTILIAYFQCKCPSECCWHNAYNLLNIWSRRVKSAWILLRRQYSKSFYCEQLKPIT